MVAVTLPVQQAWTRLQARKARHQSGRENTQLGLRPLHRGECKRQRVGAGPVKKPELDMSPFQKFWEWPLYSISPPGDLDTFTPRNPAKSPLQARGGSETQQGGSRLIDSSNHLFFSSLAQMSPGLPVQAQHKGCGGGPP